MHQSTMTMIGTEICVAHAKIVQKSTKTMLEMKSDWSFLLICRATIGYKSNSQITRKELCDRDMEVDDDIEKRCQLTVDV